MATTAAFGVGACYLTTDFTGLSSGGGPSELPETGPDAVADAPAEGSQGDGGVGDAGDAGDAAFTCTGASFCDDFERVGLVGLWDQVLSGAGGMPALTTHAKDGKSALRLNLAAATNNSAGLSKQLGQANTLRYTFSIFMTDAPTREVHLGSISVDYANRHNGLFLIFSSAGLSYAEQETVGGTQTFYNGSPPLTPVLNQWVEVDIQLDFSMTPTPISVTYGGQQLMTGTLARQYAPTTPKITAGVTYATAGNATTIDVDDVFAKITPP